MKQDEIQVVEAEAVHLAALDGPPQLTEAQERFCQFYVCGGMQYAGQADRCYREVFDIKHGDTEAAARRLVHNPAVMARIRELGTEMISERHRHRYEFNNAYRIPFQEAGMVFSGINPQRNLVEIAELPDHPFFIGVQFHPEFQSRPDRPHPLFLGFVAAALAYGQKGR